MSFKFSAIIPAAAIAVAVLSTSAFATISPAKINLESNAAIHSIGFSDNSGEAQLKRLLARHTFYLPITGKARAATGDPNIVVLDRRTGGGAYQCTYFTLRGKRAMICD